MRAVEHGDIAVRNALGMQLFDLVRDPKRLLFAVYGVVTQHGRAVRLHRNEVLFDAIPVLANQGIADG